MVSVIIFIFAHFYFAKISMMDFFILNDLLLV